MSAPETLCEDCPPVGYPTDKTRCLPCPRRMTDPLTARLSELLAKAKVLKLIGDAHRECPVEIDAATPALALCAAAIRALATSEPE